MISRFLEGSFQNYFPVVWPSNRDSEESTAFERVHLPNDGRELLKPPLKLFKRELHSVSARDGDQSITNFEAGNKSFQEQHYRKAIEFYRTSGEAATSLSSLLAQGVSLMMVSEIRDAVHVFEVGRVLARRRQAKRFEAVFRINLGQALIDLGEAERSREVLEGARNLSRRVQDPFLEATALGHLGLLSFVYGLYDEGLEYCDLALKTTQEESSCLRYAGALFVKGVLQMARGDLQEAENVFRQCIDESAIQDSHTEIRIFQQLTLLHLLRGRVREAKESLELSFRIIERITYPQGEARSLGLLALIHFSTNEVELGHATFERSLELDRRTGYRCGEIRQCLAWGKKTFSRDREGKLEPFFGMPRSLRKQPVKAGHSVRRKLCSQCWILGVQREIRSSN